MYTARNAMLVLALSVLVGTATFVVRRETRTATRRANVDAALDRHQRGLSALDHALADHIRECAPTEDELLPMPTPSEPGADR